MSDAWQIAAVIAIAVAAVWLWLRTRRSSGRNCCGDANPGTPSDNCDNCPLNSRCQKR